MMKEYKLKINGNNYDVVINNVADTQAEVEVNGTVFHVEFEKPATKQSSVKVVRPATITPSTSAAAKPAAAPAPAQGVTTVSSPLPGVILEICVKENETVKQGQKLLVLEAMKMENVIEAPNNGTVKSIKVNKGDSVLEGVPLVILG